MDKFLAVWIIGHLNFLFKYYEKNNLDKTSLLKAEKEIFTIPLVRKYYWKYKLKRHVPLLHDALVKIKRQNSSL
jgi:hypothetical protein